MENFPSPRILDGGLSNVLEAMGCNLEHPLWTAQLIETNPEMIIEAHLMYLRAGANFITSAGYQASVEGYLQLGKSEEQAEDLIKKAVELASKAKQLFLEESPSNQSIKVAASMGPYGAFLADGSEYTGVCAISDENLSLFHQRRIDLLKFSTADCFAFETIPSLREVALLSQLLMKVDTPSWVSFSCKDAVRLNDGNQLSDAIALIAEHPSIFGIGVNCTSPKFISRIVETIKRYAPQKEIIVYPNSGEVYDAESKSWQGLSDPNVFEKLALEWRKKGADIIGGCCRIGPEHISRIRNMFNKA